MGILNRFSDVVRSNINALIDRAEDPEKMANQIILDLEKLQREVVEGVAVAIAEEKRLGALAEQNRAEVERWESRAVDALKRGDEDLARQALQQKQRFESDYETFRLQHQNQIDSVNTLKSNMRELNSKVEEARRRRDNLVARSNSARVQGSVARATNTASALDAMGKLDKMERKVDQQASLAEAYQELNREENMEAKFKKIEHEEGLDAELAALKARISEEGQS